MTVINRPKPTTDPPILRVIQPIGRCKYCGTNANPDKHGNCISCGAPK